MIKHSGVGLCVCAGPMGRWRMGELPGSLATANSDRRCTCHRANEFSFFEQSRLCFAECAPTPSYGQRRLSFGPEGGLYTRRGPVSGPLSCFCLGFGRLAGRQEASEGQDSRASPAAILSKRSSVRDRTLPTAVRGVRDNLA